MLGRIVIAHLKITFSLKRLALFCLALLLFLAFRLISFQNYLQLFDREANLMDWLLYSTGGAVGDNRLASGLFFFILLSLLLTFNWSITGSDPSLSAILLTKLGSRLKGLSGFLLSQVVTVSISLTIILLLSLLMDRYFFPPARAGQFFHWVGPLQTFEMVLIFLPVTFGISILSILHNLQALLTGQDSVNLFLSLAGLLVLIFFHIFCPLLDPVNPVGQVSWASYLSNTSSQFFTILGPTVVWSIILFTLYQTTQKSG